MKMTAPAEFRANDMPLDLDEIDRSVIHGIMLRRVLSIGTSGQIAMLIAVALMGFAVMGIGDEKLMWALIAVQCILQTIVATINRMLLRRLDANQPDDFLYAIFVCLKGLTGAVWGLMMLPVVTNLGTGLGPLLICITLIVTITISAMLTTAVWIISIAAIIGFFVTMFPQALYFYYSVGPVPLIVTLILPSTLFWMTSVQSKQARAALVSELENKRLALYLEDALQQSDYLARHDSLTGLLNRRAFQLKLSELRQEQPEAAISLILVDLDHFKSINDNFGHESGDAVLVSTAEIIDSVTRPDDLSARCDEATARWGGEEFIIALVGCPIEAAASVSERLRVRIAAQADPKWADGLSVTGSFGVAIWNHQEDLADGIARADKAMYRAKISGRNQVELAA
jgi:diguanylate cyclase (GGDEF)-like protein